MSTTTMSAGTIAKLLQQIQDFQDQPLKEWMQRAGFGPENCSYLVLPKQLEKMFEERRVPAFVKFSDLLTQPMLIQGKPLL